MCVVGVVNCGKKLNNSSYAEVGVASFEMAVKVCEEVKKECIGTWFHDASYLYFHKKYRSIT